MDYPFKCVNGLAPSYYPVDLLSEHQLRISINSTDQMLLTAVLENGKKSQSVHSEQKRYFNVSVPAFFCIITVLKPVRVEIITVNNVIVLNRLCL